MLGFLDGDAASIIAMASCIGRGIARQVAPLADWVARYFARATPVNGGRMPLGNGIPSGGD
jgi:hypothetical protein